MTLELDRKDLLSLLKGTSPYYSVFDHPKIKENGFFIGGFSEKWFWNDLSNLSEEEICEIYLICKNSYS